MKFNNNKNILNFRYFSNTFTSFTLKYVVDLLIPMSLSISLNLSDSLILLHKTSCLYSKLRILFFLQLIMLLNSLTTSIASSQLLMSSNLKFNCLFWTILPSINDLRNLSLISSLPFRLFFASSLFLLLRSYEQKK